MRILKIKTGWLIRLEKGEEIIKSLLDFANKNNIKSGFFWGIGAVSQANLGFYKLDKKEYFDKDFNKPMEVTCLIGNLSKFNDDLTIHAHANLSDSDFNLIGGHLNSAIVAATLEIYFTEFNSDITRKFSNKIGLKLLKL